MFEVKVYKLEILPHPNADAIELAKVGDYLSIVKKGQFKTGDLGVYIPEQSLLPHALVEELGLTGKLHGSNKNRVKAIKLRGVLSQGLIYPAKSNWIEDLDVTALLGIEKWDPMESVPAPMRGKTVGVDQAITINYDIENVKKYNQALQDGEEVILTEKIHGTFVQMGYVPASDRKPYLHLGCFTVTSKGMGGRGIILDGDDKNVYSLMMKNTDLISKLVCIKAEYKDLVGDRPIYLCGEIFGTVQKGFHYGCVGNSFRMFDIAYGHRGDLRYVDADLLMKIAQDYELPMVPVLYRGPFSKEVMLQYTSGKETVSGHMLHMREGVVVKPIKERIDVRAGRVILKSISEEYLTRKGDTTEYN